MLRIERSWREHGVRKRCVDYAITSLPPDRADADVRLRRKRGHGTIENRLPWCLDTVLREDPSLIHAGHEPRVMSLLRALALNLLRLAGLDQIAAPLRARSRHPDRAVSSVLQPLTRA